MKKTLKKAPPKSKDRLDHLIHDSNTDTPVATKPTSFASAMKASLPTSNAPHLIVEARAGTGKTTTLVEGLKRVKGIASKLTPSPQQAAVWDSMALSRDAQNVCFVAFNKSIADELKTRVPEGCQAMTMHSMGLKAVTNAYGRLDVNQYRVQDIIADLLGQDLRELKRKRPLLIKAVEDLVSLCKANLVNLEKDVSIHDETAGLIHRDWVEEQLDTLSSYYDVELNGSKGDVYDLVPKVLKRCKDVDADRKMDYDDMVWLPVVLDLPVFRYDLLLVDEAQDLNRCQQALAKKSGHRLILCGDPCQAIYGFAGADAESMPRMAVELGKTPRGCITLPLTVTRRCGKAIVAEAQQYVPDFEAFDTNPEGSIRKSTMEPTRYKGQAGPGTGPIADDGYRGLARIGDMVLCRVNAPLVSQCFKFLKAGRKANIQGRDIGKGLIKTIEKQHADTVPELIMRLDDWRHAEEAKELAKRNPNLGKISSLQDRFDCILCFAEGQATVQQVIDRINSVFTDEKQSEGIRLSSIHKAKGLEAKQVFLLRPKGAECPHPMAKSKWQKQQEHNLLYVAITRAIESFVYVS